MPRAAVRRTAPAHTENCSYRFSFFVQAEASSLQGRAHGNKLTHTWDLFTHSNELMYVSINFVWHAVELSSVHVPGGWDLFRRVKCSAGC